MEQTPIEKWELIGHSYQIADTGDYDGCYEIKKGKISLFTKDDDEELLQPIVDVLNNSGCKFYQDDGEVGFLKSQIDLLKAERSAAIQEVCKLRDEVLNAKSEGWDEGKQAANDYIWNDVEEQPTNPHKQLSK